MARASVRGLGRHQLDGSQGGVGNGAKVVRTKGRSVIEESECALSQVCPRGPSDGGPEAEQGAARGIVARAIVGPSTVAALT
jgi:hypothetical protein